ncbi:MAG: hypothetical protein HZA79_02565 [Sphingobacteriales bacterium]|nr:hypothetical protein [Sphingobacteriales bacterium]
MKFLFTTLPTNDLGLITRALPVAAELSSRGHEVIFSNPASAPSKLIAEAGFKNEWPIHPLYRLAFQGANFRNFFRMVRTEQFRKEYGSLPHFIWKLARSIPFRFAPAVNEVWDTDHACAITGLLNYNFVKSLCDAYAAVMVKTKPDAVVDCWNPLACIACKKRGIPLITINQADALPGSKGFIWWKKKPGTIPGVVPVFNRVLRKFGMSRVENCEELNRGDLTLVTGTPATDPLEGVNDFHYTGALVWQRPGSAVPAWFQDLPRNKPVIWLYGGNPHYGGRSSIFDSSSMVKACLAALKNGDWTVVFSKGYHELSKETAILPSNFISVPFVPGLLMGSRADLLIHHGGYGSCQAGLLCGKPSLVLPTFSERESNARRIAKLGAGDYVLPQQHTRGEKKFSAGEIREKVKTILSDPRYRTCAETQRDELLRYGGAVRAADLVEKFTSGRAAKETRRMHDLTA